LAKRIENVLFSHHLHQFLSKNISRATIFRAQSQHILAAEACNRTVENGRTCSSLADFSGDLWSESGIGWLAHQPQYLLNAIV
jgi:hypothetical protein